MTAGLLAKLSFIFVITVLGGFPPLFKSWNPKQLHIFIALSAGVFLGVLFLDILPEISEQKAYVWHFTLLGFLLILLFEKLLIFHHDVNCDDHKSEHVHEATGISIFTGLSIHSMADGMLLGTFITAPTVAVSIFFAIAFHKALDAFTLSAVFNLANYPFIRKALFMTLFSLITPVFAVLGIFLFRETLYHTIFMGIAAGAFLYVAACDLLPQAFHDEFNATSNFISLFAGILIVRLFLCQLHV